MKKTIYISAIIVVNLILFGSLFKIMHWPGAGVLMTIGYILLCVWIIPASLLNHYRCARQRKKKWLYIVVFLVVFIDLTGALFKIQHWPGAALLMMVGVSLPFILFLPVYVYHHNKDKNASNKEFLAVLFLLIYIAVFSVFLAMGVSKNILDNHVLTGNNVEKSNAILAQTINHAMSENSNQKQKTIHSHAIMVYDLLKQSRNALWNEAGADAEHKNLMYLPKKEDISLAGHIMLTSKEEGFNKGEEIKNGIENFRNVVSCQSEGQIDDPWMEKLLSTKNVYPEPGNKDWQVSWEEFNFRGNQLVSVFNYLGLIESNVLIAEIAAMHQIEREDTLAAEVK